MNWIKIWIPLFILISGSVAADDMALGLAEQEAGNHSAAVIHFSTWLSENVNNAGFPAVLQHYMDSIEDLNAAIVLLEEIQSICTKTENKSAITLELAFLQEISGNINRAQQTFEVSNFISTSQKDLVNFFHSIRLLISMGELDRAKAQTQAIVTTSSDSKMITEGSLYLSYISHLLDDS